MDQETL